MKRIVVCCDGAWTVADRGDGALTNVRKLWELIRSRDDHGVPQTRTYYAGAAGDVATAYRDCAARYEPGDELFLFGFSRGATAVRSLAGLIGACGLLRREHLDKVGDALGLWRNGREGNGALAAREFRQRVAHETRIRFIGVWDTAGPAGVPGRGPASALHRRRALVDLELAPWIDHACQALALDERRRRFEPALWRQPPVAAQTLEQVWFAGVHADVGGGYEDSSLSDIPLLWMMDRASDCGLPFLTEVAARRLAADPLAFIHDPVTGLDRALDGVAGRLGIVRGRLRVRAVGAGPDTHETVASSVMVRHREMRPPYRPANLRRFLAGGGTVTQVRLAP